MSASLKPTQVPADEHQQARIDLAACHRLAARFGFHEGIDNHLTLLVPGHSDRFYLAPFGLHWSEVRARDFLVIDFDSHVVSGQGPVEDTALFIHLPVHRLAPQARCALHTHMPYATALCMLENPRLEMASQAAIGFYSDIAYEADYNGLAFDKAEGERLAQALGDKSVLMMRNHGCWSLAALWRRRSSGCISSSELVWHRCWRCRRGDRFRSFRRRSSARLRSSSGQAPLSAVKVGLSCTLRP